MMKKVILAAILSSSLLANVSFAGDVTSYQEAVKIINHGNQLTLVVNFDKCIINNNHGGKLTGISSIKTPEVTTIRNNQITGTTSVPTSAVPELPELGYVYQTSTWSFDNKNHFSAQLSVLDPVTYADKIPTTQIDCDLGIGISIYS